MEEKKWWIVVGGIRRLGLALAQQLAEKHRLVLTSSKAPDIEGLSGLSIRTDTRLLHWDADDPGLASRMMTDLEALKGEEIVLQGAILVAGTFPFSPLGAWNESNLQETWRVNLTFPFLAIQSLAPHLAEGSCIQIMLDTCIHRPLLNRLPYSCAKSGLAALVTGLACLLAPKIRVVGHAIGTMLPDETSPVGFLENQTLLKHIGTPEELCKAVLYADASPSMTGEILTLDGGSRWR